VKYMIIIYGNRALWESYPPDEWRERIAEFDGQPIVTDGPYLETKEYLASWYLVEVDSEERALAIAATVPAATMSQVEVWPVRHEAGR